MIFGAAIFFTVEALTVEAAAEEAVVLFGTPLLTILTGFKYEEVLEEAAEVVLLVPLAVAGPAGLLEAAEVEVWVTILGSVEGMGLPSLVCNLTTFWCFAPRM